MNQVFIFECYMIFYKRSVYLSVLFSTEQKRNCGPVICSSIAIKAGVVDNQRRLASLGGCHDNFVSLKYFIFNVFEKFSCVSAAEEVFSRGAVQFSSLSSDVSIFAIIKTKHVFSIAWYFLMAFVSFISTGILLITL